MNKIEKSRQILNFIIKQKSKGNAFQELNIQMKILIKGVNVKEILEGTLPDYAADETVSKLEAIAQEFGVDLKKMPQ